MWKVWCTAKNQALWHTIAHLRMEAQQPMPFRDDIWQAFVSVKWRIPLHGDALQGPHQMKGQTSRGFRLM